MSRFAHLVRHPRRTLAVLATVTTAVGVTVASGADFTASVGQPGQHVQHRHAVDVQQQAPAPRS